MYEALQGTAINGNRMRKVANGCGLLAILMWAALALLTAHTLGVPPFQLSLLSFSIPFGLACLAAMAGWAGGFRAWRQSPGALIRPALLPLPPLRP